MPARPYCPAAPVGAARLAAALGWAGLSAAVVGAAAHAVTRATYYVDIVVPGAVGLACGASLAWAVGRLRLSRPAPAALLAAAAAVAALVVLLDLDFLAARAARAERIDHLARVRQGLGLVGEEELAAVRRSMLRDFTFARYAAGRIGWDDSGMLTGAPPVLGRTGAVALSAFELLLAALVAGAWAGRAAGHPACPRCGRWRVERALGSAAHGVARPLIEHLLAGDAGAAAAAVRPRDTREQTLLTLLRCPEGHDGDGGVLRVSDVRWTRRRRGLSLRRVADLEVDGAAVAAIAGALSREEA